MERKKTIQEIHNEINLPQSPTDRTKQTTADIKSDRKPVYVPYELRRAFLQRLDWRIKQNSNNVKSLILNEEIEGVIELVCQYLNNEFEFEKDGRDFNKGLLLGGKVGSGKTEIIWVYHDLRRQLYEGKVRFKTCHDMNLAFKKVDEYTGEERRYTDLQPFVGLNNLTEIIFDDLGDEETTVMDYGNRISIMPYIFNERYKNRQNCGKTHMTTNLSKEGILEKYGSRFDSRLYEMMNLIGLGTVEDSIDHRKQ